ncbi:MAG: phosphatase PAP2 family protein [Desulfuromonas thiophila]|nr:phosphatase PAP2 family protein [Desulfuromonas thiophila]
MNSDVLIRPWSLLFWPTVSFVTLMIVALSGLDQTLAEIFYDRQLGLWPYKHSWWAETLIHDGGRKIVIITAATSLILVLLSRLDRFWHSFSRPALYLLLCIGLGTGLVATGKYILDRPCPWSLQQYGGTRQEISWRETLSCVGLTRAKSGHCFPAGHSAGAFSLSAGYFIFLKHNRKRAQQALFLSLALGCLFSFGQIARGAHFLSHCLCSAWLCWVVNWVLYFGPFKGKL